MIVWSRAIRRHPPKGVRTPSGHFMPISNEKRRILRREIAEYCVNHTIGQAARKFGVSVSLVRSACWEHDVEPFRQIRANLPLSFAVLKMLLDGTPRKEIAQDLGLKLTYVHTIARTAQSAGFRIESNRKHVYRWEQ